MDSTKQARWRCYHYCRASATVCSEARITFCLDSTTSDGHGGLTIGATNTGTWAMQMQIPQDLTTLNHGQCQELLAALTREHNLIQGPPGTGKSSYYNHVLHQFLKHLLEAGISKIIRIGSRSRAPELEGKSLRVVSEQVEKTCVENQILSKSYELFPVAQLDVQRRMQPDISRLARSANSNLQGHASVKSLPSVVGLRHNLFWLDHGHVEDMEDDGSRLRSHSNQWEVDMAAGLVRCQLRKLRQDLSSDFEISLSNRDLDTLAADGVGDDDEDTAKPQAAKRLQKKSLIQTLHLATVNNFQGEEAKVIIVSLVRGNRVRKLGFLLTENRVNVLLSQTYHDMYLIGNPETYLHVGRWADVHDQLAYDEAIGKSLSLCYPSSSRDGDSLYRA
ncbi:hypothetical protein DL770_010956 [Monosporascus sp. CRB-9-2]|nr:hypothetical protein DL770_010956 [Monosporascus sp. CRB-9-2]